MRVIFIIIYILSFYIPFSLEAKLWNAAGSLPEGNVYTIEYIKDSTLLAAIEGHGLYKTIDNGINWTLIKSIDSTKLFRDILLLDDGSWLLAVNGEGVYISKNEGLSWVEYNTGLTNKNIVQITQAPNNDIYAASWFFGGVFKKQPGKDWVLCGLSDKDVSAVCALSDGKILAGAIYYGGFSSTNEGIKWEEINFAGATPKNYIETDQGYVFAATSNGVYRASISDLIFSKKSDGISSSLILAALGIDEDVIMIGTSFGGVHRSLDNGENWELANDSLNDETDVLSFCRDSSGFVYAGTNKGVFRSFAPLTKPNINIYTSINADTLDWEQNYEMIIKVIDSWGIVLSNTDLYVHCAELGISDTIITDNEGKAVLNGYIPINTNDGLYKVDINPITVGYKSVISNEGNLWVKHKNTDVLEKLTDFKYTKYQNNDVLYINMLENIDDIEISLYNIIGNQIFNKNYNYNCMLNIPLQEYSEGIYFIEIKNKNKIIRDSFIKK